MLLLFDETLRGSLCLVCERKTHGDRNQKRCAGAGSHNKDKSNKATDGTSQTRAARAETR